MKPFSAISPVTILSEDEANNRQQHHHDLQQATQSNTPKQFLKQPTFPTPQAFHKTVIAQKPAVNIVSPPNHNKQHRTNNALKPPLVYSPSNFKTPPNKRSAPLTNKSISRERTSAAAVKPTIATNRLFEDTVNLITHHNILHTNPSHNHIHSHGVALSVVAVAMDIPITSLLHHIDFTSLSLSLFFENMNDVRAKTFKLVKLLDSSYSLSIDQRGLMKILVNQLTTVTSEPNPSSPADIWTELVKEVVRSFLLRHMSNHHNNKDNSEAASRGSHIAAADNRGEGYCEVEIGSYLYSNALSLSLGAPITLSAATSSIQSQSQCNYTQKTQMKREAVILLPPPRSKVKKPKHFLVPMLLPEVNDRIDCIDFHPGRAIFLLR